MQMRCFTLIMLYIFAYSYVLGQTKEELENKKEKYLKEISLTNELLEENKKEQKVSIQRIRLINSKINNRTLLIKNLEEEIDLLNERIKLDSTIITALRSDKEEIKIEYEKSIYYAYKSYKTQDKIMYILSSESFNQAYKRIKYLKQFTSFRREQIVKISEIELLLSEKITKLEEIRREKIYLVENKINEKNVLSNEKVEFASLRNNLQKKERLLKKKLEEQRRIKNAIELEIKNIIALIKKKEESKRYTEEDFVFSNGFNLSKGKLIWPIEEGVVTEYFGQHYHPVLKGIKTTNNGIDITTNQNEKVKAIYNGYVSKVFGILGSNYTVIIRHGNYLSIYQNLINIRVKQGEKIRTGDVIGEVYVDSNTNNSILHFEIWDELKKMDPIIWLSKK